MALNPHFRTRAKRTNHFTTESNEMYCVQAPYPLRTYTTHTIATQTQTHIQHWVHLRCAGIRLAQYSDTWTCHQHKESRLTTHTDITPLQPQDPGSKRPSTPPPQHLPHHRNQNTDTYPYFAMFLQD